MRTPHPSVVGQRFASVALVDNGQPTPEVVEVGVVHVDAGGITGEPRTWLVRPEHPITRYATRAYHLSDADVAAAPRFPEIRDEVAEALSDRVVVAHRGAFTRALLRSQLPRWEPPAVLDTRRLAARVWPSQPSRSLGELIRRARLTVGGREDRAGHAAQATAALFLVLVDRLDTTTERLFEIGRPDPVP